MDPATIAAMAQAGQQLGQAAKPPESPNFSRADSFQGGVTLGSFAPFTIVGGGASGGIAQENGRAVYGGGNGFAGTTTAVGGNFSISNQMVIAIVAGGVLVWMLSRKK